MLTTEAYFLQSVFVCQQFIHTVKSLQYKMHQIPTLKKFSYCHAAVFDESLEARCQVENEDVFGAAPIGDAPTTSEWSTILLPTKVRLILEVLQYITCAGRWCKSLAVWLFVWQLVEANNQENINTPHLVTDWPVIQKAFPFYNIIMWWDTYFQNG